MSEPKNVLVLDDPRENVITLVATAIQGCPDRYRYQCVSTTVEAIALCRLEPPDCLVLPYLLGTETGIDFMEELQETLLGLPCPVLMLTAHGNERLAVTAMKRGASDYLAVAQTSPTALREAIEEATHPKHHAEVNRLQETQHLIQGVAEAAPNILYLFDLQRHRNLYTSKHIAESLGYSTQAVAQMGDAFLDIVLFPDDFPRLMAHFISFATATDHEVRTIDYRMRHADGTLRWFQSRDVVFARDEQGVPTQIVGSAMDITALKRAEERLEKAQSVARLGAAEVNLKTGQIFWSDEHFRLLGYDPQAFEPTLEHILARAHPEHRERLRTNLLSVSHPGEHEGEYLFVLPDGTERWFRFKIESGAVNQGTGTILDVTERVLAEKALRYSEQSLKRAQATAHIGSTEIDLKTGKMEWSDELYRLFGYEPQSFEPTLEHVFTRLHPDHIARFHRNNDLLMQGKIPTECRDYLFVMPTGEERWLRFQGTIVLDTPERGAKVITTGIDITEQKRMEETLREAEAERNYIVQTAGCVLWSANIEEREGELIWDIRYFNEEAAYRLVPIDLQPDKTFIESWLAARLEEDWAQDDVLAKRYFRQGKDFQHEFRIRAATGAVHWLRDDVQVEVLEPGKRWHVVGVLMDVTALKQALEAAYRWDRVFDAAAFGLTHVDAKTNTFLAVNPTFARQRGYTPEELIGRSVLEVYPPEMRPYIQQRMVFNERINHCMFETIHQRKDGSRFPVQMEVTLIRDADGTPVSGIAYAQDITERKQTDEALRREQERFTQIAATVPGVLYSFRLRTDQSMCMTYFTPGLTEFVDVEPERLHEDATPLFDQIHPDDRERMMSGIFRSAETLSYWHDEFRVRHATKEIIWLEGRATPVREPDGSTLWYGFMADVSERKRAEAEILALNSHLEQRVQERTEQLALAIEEAERERVIAVEARYEAERANQAKSEFLSRMSHELRTPMNSILGFAQVMEMQVTEKKQADRIAHILQAGRHLLRLINEVLDIARVESGHLDLHLEPTPVETTVQSALNLIYPLCKQSNIHLKVDTDSLEHHRVLADPQYLSQVLLNLLSNAVKYNRPQGRVHVFGERRENHRLRICISDEGHGISAAGIARLFQPFERLNADDGPVEGTGLGLALSKRLVEAMEGQIGVQSVVDIGSTFWIELPLTAPTTVTVAAATEVPRISKATTPDPHHTVVYIEDNKVNIQLVREVLNEREDIQLLTALDGTSGLTLVRESHPELILLDLHLPGLSGEEVLYRLKEDPVTQNIPVVVVTADTTPNLDERLRRAGITAFVTKPIDVPRFLEVVSDVLA